LIKVHEESKTSHEAPRAYTYPLVSEDMLQLLQEVSDHNRSYFKHKLAFAILLKFYEREGRPLLNSDLIPLDLLTSLSVQLDCDIEDCESFDWEGRTAKRFRQKIRAFLGYRTATLSDVQGLTTHLIQRIADDGLTLSQCRVEADIYLKIQKLEPFKSDVTDTRVKLAYHHFEKGFFKVISAALSSHSRTTLDQLIDSDDGLPVVQKSEVLYLRHIKQETKGSRKNNVGFEIKKLQRLRSLELPKDLFKGFSHKLIKKYFLRIGGEIPSDLKSHSESIRLSTLAAFCHHRSHQITDTLVDQFKQMIHRVRTKSETSLKDSILKSVKRVDGKFDILYSLAELSLGSPEGKIEEVIYPKVSASTLKNLVKELKHRGNWYTYNVNKNMYASYAHSARSVLFSILDMLDFKSQNPAQTLVLKSLSLIKKYKDSPDKYFPSSEDVPVEGLISDSWSALVSIENEDGKTLINRFNYEMAIFEVLSSKLTFKDVWVDGAYRYRDPDSDVPVDFYENKETYFKELDLPLNPDDFIKPLQEKLTLKLQNLNDTLPFNTKIKILKRKNKSHIKVSPSEPQEEPMNLILLKNEIHKRWPIVNLLDLLKETNDRTNFTQHFKTIAANQKLPNETLSKRLLLCLCALGNNTGLKRMSASNGDENYSDLCYIKRRFINAENIRNALVDIINATIDIRDPKIWGIASTGCACDSKQLGSWMGNIMSSWHPRYKDYGVMVYWHVDTNSLCIYSQLKNCTSSEVASMLEGVLRHSTKMNMTKTYTDTHGQSTLGFAFSELLKVDLLPRIKRIHVQKLHVAFPGDKKKYPHLKDILESPINWDLIREQYDEIVKYTAALKKGTAETDVLLKRFSKDNYEHPTYQALMELGKANKSIFLCRYLAEEELRIEINASLNIVERVNGVVDFLFFGKLGEVSTNNTVDQENTILSLQLLQVCLVYINTLMIQEVLKDPVWKDKFTPEDWRALTPLIHAHINPYGLFPLDMSKSLDIEKSEIKPQENDNDIYQNAA